MDPDDEIMKAAAEDYGDCPIDFSANKIRRLRTELERAKGDVNSYRTKLRICNENNERLKIELQKRDEAIKEALGQFEIIGGSGRYPDAMEILRKAVQQ